MNALRFDAPWALFMLTLLPVVLVLRRRYGQTPLWLVPYAGAWAEGSATRRSRRILGLYLGVLLLVIAVARPQRIENRIEETSPGYDLVLAIDLSTSMLSEDYSKTYGSEEVPINRLDAVRPVIQAFIAGRPQDRIALVIFAGYAYTLSPLTLDHDWLETRVADLSIEMIEDGTAIGDGLGIALTQLEAGRDDGDAVGAFVILLTDGANTSGRLTPAQAASIAQHRGVPVYTIGAGRNGMVPFPYFDMEGRRAGARPRMSNLDEDTLRAIAAKTGGYYFKADDSEAVASAFSAIDAAQKTEFQSRIMVRTSELFAWFAAPALLCLLLAMPALRPAMPRAIKA